MSQSLLVESAAAYAATKHKDQKYGDDPYVKHLASVVEVLVRFGHGTETMMAAGWLHDSVEDTDATIEEIKLVFGEAVSKVVYAVTNEPGVNRKERHAKTYPKIKASPEGTILKLADRIANVEACIDTKDDKIGMYKKEHLKFKEFLYESGPLDPMWRHLDFLIGE